MQLYTLQNKGFYANYKDPLRASKDLRLLSPAGFL